MARRSVCLYNGNLLGIESIYTLSNGKQINIPKKTEEVRKLGREKKLFCPCGCGNNLTLVAGDRNLREQHFRMKKVAGARECIAVEEGTLSITSKITLKCWMDNNLQSDKIESRVSIDRVYETNRKFEFTFYDFLNKIGICYWYDRANITSDKIDIIQSFIEDKKMIYITNSHNAGSNGQYPEFVIKIQNAQGYVVYLKIDENDDYKDVYLMIKIYVQNQCNEWEELSVLEDKLDCYTISSTGNLLYREQFVSELAESVAGRYKADVMRKIEEKKDREEWYNKELERKTQSRGKRFEGKQKAFNVENAQRKKSILQNNQKEKVIDVEYEEEVKRIKSSKLYLEKPVIMDSKGKKWYLCQYCGQRFRAMDCHVYWVKGNKNVTTCKGCKEHYEQDIDRKLIQRAMKRGMK